MYKNSFPYEPYGIQLSLMEALEDCMDKELIGILESPTGTGKSLSIICAALTWLERTETREKSNLAAAYEHVDKVDDDDDWVNSYREKFNKCLKHKVNLQSSIYASIKQKLRFTPRKRPPVKRVFIEQEPPESNDDDSSDSEIYYPKEPTYESTYERSDSTSDDEFRNSNLLCRKIIYASRTHTQLEQFAEEVKKTRFRPRIVTLGSRKLLCLNKSVKMLNNSHLVTEKCRVLRSANKRKDYSYLPPIFRARMENRTNKCPFSHKQDIEDLCKRILNTEISTVAKLNEYGMSGLACPYYSSREALPLCELVLVPYQILLQDEARKAWNLDLHNSVVIIDEAHNLLETICSTHSATITLSALENAAKTLNDYVRKYRSRQKPHQLKYQRQIYSLIVKWSRLLKFHVKAKKDCAEDTKSLSMKIGIEQVDLHGMLDYIDRSHLCSKLHNYSVRSEIKIRWKKKCSAGVESLLKRKGIANEKKPERVHREPILIDDKAYNPFYAVKQFLSFLTMNYDDGCVVYECSKGMQEAKLKFQLLNPGPKLKALLDEPRSFIMIGGTMEPSEQLFNALRTDCEVDSKRIVKSIFGHVISDNQLLAFTIGNVDDVEMQFTYEKRSTVPMLDGLGKCLIELVKNIPNGVIAFFCSYDYLEYVENKLSTNGSLAALRRIKPVFIEKRGGSPKIFAQFGRDARTKTGALLCAVVGGKMSEGINFSDELGRAVIMIGMPYANKSDLILTEQRKFLDQRYGHGAGMHHYETKCMHAVNQSVGRVIRHEKDYAAIIFLDSRFKQKRISNMLPSWIKGRLSQAKDLSDAVEKLQLFFKK